MKLRKIIAVTFLLSLFCTHDLYSFAKPIIIDHTCTDLNKVPASWITQAKSKFKIAYGHQSHGNQILRGMTVLMGEYPLYSYNSSGTGGALSVQHDELSTLDYPKDNYWEQEARAVLSAPGNDRNFFMWSWCYGVSSASAEDINTYLTLMDGLEKDYPNVIFVYMTGHLDPINDDVNNLNNQIRTFCRKNNKLLFDFADIESCNPDGTCFLDQGASYNCDYSNGLKNWAGEWITAHPDSELAQLTSKCEVCDHSPDDQYGTNTTTLARLNCILKGRAFWWMIAAAAGWTPGQPTSSTTTSSGGGGGGTHTTTAAATTTTAVTSTSTILPATTTTIQPPQECASDADCDDGLFCNGSERCDNGICVPGDNPCNAGKLCREDMDTCWDIVILNASCVQENFRRPALRATRCPWLLVNCADDNHFNAIHSAITIEGPSENAQGVEVDGGRNPFKMGNVIFIPVCIGKDASVGQWKIKIKTANGTIETPFEETIEAHFLVQ